MEPPISDTKRNFQGYEELPNPNRMQADIQIEVPLGTPPPASPPIPFQSAQVQTPSTPLTPSSLLPSSYEGCCRQTVRAIILTIEFIWVVVVLTYLSSTFIKYMSLKYSILSTTVQVRDTSITYTTVSRPQILFFFYSTPKINSTEGIIVTQQYYVEQVNLTEKCDNKYEYYGSQGQADEVAANLDSYLVLFTIGFAMSVILICAIIKLLILRYVRANDIPMMLKLKMKSKTVYEMTLYTIANVIIVALVGSLIPLIALDYDNYCLISTIGYSVDGLYKGFNGLMVCLICFIIPLIFFVFYTYAEDDMKYCCFAVFWVMLPAFLVVLGSGHAISIFTAMRTTNVEVFYVMLGNYIMLILSFIATMTISIIDGHIFGKKRAATEQRDTRIMPIGFSAKS